MKKFALSVTALVVFLCASAQPVDQGSMQAWQDYMKPGKVHEWLAKSEGKWKTEASMWTDPSKEPMKSIGECENKMILGGRYLTFHYTGNFMNMPFEGYGVVAYDNDKKMFYQSWVDNMGTGLMNMQGTWDEATKTITFTGTSYDALMKMDMNEKQVMKFTDDNHYTMEMYTIMDNREMKTMEMNYTRM